MNNATQRWLGYMVDRIGFYQRSGYVSRRESGFAWKAVDHAAPRLRCFVKSILKLCGLLPTRPSLYWLRSQAPSLWEARCLLADDASRLLFDAILVQRHTNHQQFFMPRHGFRQILEVLSQEAFPYDNLPSTYGAQALKIMRLRLCSTLGGGEFRVAASQDFLCYMDEYQQYMLLRNDAIATVGAGDVVLDCGACIGDTATFFAALVGTEGAVHSFDPLPLHIEYCRLQQSLNPDLAPRMHCIQSAIGSTSGGVGVSGAQPGIVSPDYKPGSLPCISIDEYAEANLERVNFIKMDIEGMELDALRGATGVIKACKPRLAICGYHYDDHLWQIPLLIKELNPEAALYLRHHSPIYWESVFYAV